jgi:hypothetical protein
MTVGVYGSTTWRPSRLAVPIMMSDTSAPRAPTIKRIQPTVTKLTPLTEMSTAHTKIAPAAIKSNDMPIPIFFSLLPDVQSRKRNAPSGARDTSR